MRGGEPDYMDKIFELDEVVLAFEGVTGIRDDFLLLLRSERDSGMPPILVPPRMRDFLPFPLVV